jgi:Ser/Thr protein kinase RdoA (MazF antagonist)
MQDVCDRFGLGAVSGCHSVAGGVSNELYRVDTERGVFAVKRMVTNAESPRFVTNIEAAYRIEHHALVSGIPMAAPVPDPDTGRVLARVDHSLWRVHRWVNAHPITTPTLIDAAHVGALLARIHRAGTGVVGGTVRSHTDLDPKNVLKERGGRLVAVDWDAAGRICPQEELVQVSLEWGLRPRRVDTPAVAAVVTGYRDAGGPALCRPRMELIASWISGRQEWLAFNQAHQRDTPAGRAQISEAVASIGLVTTHAVEICDILR